MCDPGEPGSKVSTFVNVPLHASLISQYDSTPQVKRYLRESKEIFWKSFFWNTVHRVYQLLINSTFKGHPSPFVWYQRVPFKVVNESWSFNYKFAYFQCTGWEQWRLSTISPKKRKGLVKPNLRVESRCFSFNRHIYSNLFSPACPCLIPF